MHATVEKPVRKYTVSEARAKFKDVVDEVAYTRQPAIVTKHGEKSVAVVPYDLLEIFVRLEAMLDVNKATKALREFDKDGGFTIEELKKQLGLED